MNKNFNQRERDVVKLATFFKKQSVALMGEGKLGEEHKKVEEAVDQFLVHMNGHADTRAFVFEQREYLNRLVKDNAVCPKCKTNEKLKVAGIEKNDKGWKSNRYRCRKCNIEFTWNTPNNPWHMIEYIEEMLQEMQSNAEAKKLSGDDDSEVSGVIAAMQGNLDKLKPVSDAHEKDYHDLQVREQEMERLLHEFKNSLLIEKIKMDTWENKQKSKHK